MVYAIIIPFPPTTEDIIEPHTRDVMNSSPIYLFIFEKQVPIS